LGRSGLDDQDAAALCLGRLTDPESERTACPHTRGTTAYCLQQTIARERVDEPHTSDAARQHAITDENHGAAPAWARQNSHEYASKQGTHSGTRHGYSKRLWRIVSKDQRCR